MRVIKKKRAPARRRPQSLKSFAFRDVGAYFGVEVLGFVFEGVVFGAGPPARRHPLIRTPLPPPLQSLFGVEG